MHSPHDEISVGAPESGGASRNARHFRINKGSDPFERGRRSHIQLVRASSLHNTSYAKLSSRAAAVFVAAVMTMALAPRALAAQVHPAAARAHVVLKVPTAAADAHLIDFLQKRFKIPEASRIRLGPAEPAGIDGLLFRIIDVVTDQGRHVRVTAFTDATESRIVIGTLFDLRQNPWGKVDMKLVHLEDRPTLGPADAPVTMVEFADFECPFCAHAFTIIETLANSTYKGKLRVIFKNYPLNVHPWAVRAAEGAECARLQNPAAFWDLARDLYTNQNQINTKNVNSRLDAYAHQLGLDLPSLHACMSASSTLARIRQDQEDGHAVHVTSTPTFFINGIPVVGLPEHKVFTFVIDHALEEARTSPARH